MTESFNCKKLFLVFLFLFVLKASSFSQYYYYNNDYYDNDLVAEVGASFGFMLPGTDVGRKKFTPFIPALYDVKSIKTNGSIYIGLLYQNLVGARVEYTMGSIAGTDSNSNIPFYKARNLSYKTEIHELSLIAEFYPMTLKYYDELPKWSPYVMGGIGLFKFNPQALYLGKWVDLQPLHTEGQGFAEYPDRKPYRLNAVSFPVGVGVKYELSQLFTLRLEALYRFTSTDYLDDVSTTYVDQSLFSSYLPSQTAATAAALSARYKEKQPGSDLTGEKRGLPTSNDRYLSINIKAGLTLGRQRIR